MAITAAQQKEITDFIAAEVGRKEADAVKDSYAKALERLEKASSQTIIVTESRLKAQAKRDTGVMFAALAKAGGRKNVAAGYAERAGSAVAAKALSESVLEDGGLLVSDAVAPDIAEFLRAKGVVRSSGLRQVNLPGGTLTLNRGASAAGITWVNELAKVNASQPTLAAVELAAKKGMVIIALSSELMEDTSAGAGFAADEAQMSLSQGEDIAFLLGSGVQGVPKGMSVWAANSVTAVAASAPATLVEIIADCKKVLTEYASQDLGIDDPAWYMSKRSRIAAMLATSSGLLPLYQEVAGGSLFGIPIFDSGNIPNNLGGGTESEILLVDRSKVFIGDKGGIILETFPAGTYNDSTGTLRSGISADEIIIRAKLRVDLAARYNGAEIVKLDTVKWY